MGGNKYHKGVVICRKWGHFKKKSILPRNRSTWYRVSKIKNATIKLLTILLLVVVRRKMMVRKIPWALEAAYKICSQLTNLYELIYKNN